MGIGGGLPWCLLCRAGSQRTPNHTATDIRLPITRLMGTSAYCLWYPGILVWLDISARISVPILWSETLSDYIYRNVHCCCCNCLRLWSRNDICHKSESSAHSHIKYTHFLPSSADHSRPICISSFHSVAILSTRQQGTSRFFWDSKYSPCVNCIIVSMLSSIFCYRLRVMNSYAVISPLVHSI